MGDVTALMMDAITDKSGHQIVPNAVSVCLTPAAPSPLPIPYPVICMVSEGVTDPPMRTKINGALIGTTGAVLKACHGNEAGTLKEVVSLNTGGPVFIIMGAPNILCELGMMGITGSLCISNKAITAGAGATASGAGGSASGAGAGTEGSGDSDAGEGPDAANGGGDAADGTNSGASATPATPTDRYCPDNSRTAPPPFQSEIDRDDLRNRQQQIDRHATPTARTAADHAMHGAPGSATATQGQAFWSGGDMAMAAARRDGYTIQEDAGGAAALAAQPKADQPAWSDESNSGAGSGVTGVRTWRTISRRSARASSGTVEAFVVGTAAPGNVFSAVELPTLLHNRDVDQINFRDPRHTPPPAPVVQSWARNPTDGCWEGGAVPPGATIPGDARTPIHGFRLHPTDGISRFR